MVRLPISGIVVHHRLPSGREEELLLSATRIDSHLAIELASRLASMADGGEVGWRVTPPGDLDYFLLELRRIMFGDLVRTDARCAAADCRSRVDISFRISDYLARHRPRAARGVSRDAEAGWYRLAGARFRVPNCGDQAAVEGHPSPKQELARLCVEGAEIAPGALRRIERAMDAIAPALSHELDGRCPECGAGVRVYFDVQLFTLLEMRAQASQLYRDVHLLAGSYHWSEEQILALPGVRRAHYAELVSGERSGARA
jgi:hypothetical protein